MSDRHEVILANLLACRLPPVRPTPTAPPRGRSCSSCLRTLEIGFWLLDPDTLDFLGTMPLEIFSERMEEVNVNGRPFAAESIQAMIRQR
jgi:hypothetical protein